MALPIRTLAPAALLKSAAPDSTWNGVLFIWVPHAVDIQLCWRPVTESGVAGTHATNRIHTAFVDGAPFRQVIIISSDPRCTGCDTREDSNGYSLKQSVNISVFQAQHN
jgi:hypothetical protein